MYNVALVVLLSTQGAKPILAPNVYLGLSPHYTVCLLILAVRGIDSYSACSSIYDNVAQCILLLDKMIDCYDEFLYCGFSLFKRL